MSKPIVHQVILTCPECNHRTTRIMPDIQGPRTFQCAHCQTTARAPSDVCCIYCAFGTAHCPAVQRGEEQIPET